MGAPFQRRYVVSQAVQIIETAVVNNTAALSAFRELGAAEVRATLGFFSNPYLSSRVFLFLFSNLGGTGLGMLGVKVALPFACRARCTTNDGTDRDPTPPAPSSPHPSSLTFVCCTAVPCTSDGSMDAYAYLTVADMAGASVCVLNGDWEASRCGRGASGGSSGGGGGVDDRN